VLLVDEAIVAKALESLVGCGAEEAHAVTRFEARFGKRRVQAAIRDFGILFSRRYQAKALDEAGLEVWGEPSVTVTGAIGSIPWGELKLD